MAGLNKDLEFGLRQEEKRYKVMADHAIGIEGCGNETLRGIQQGSSGRYDIPRHTVKRQSSFNVIHNRPTHTPCRKFKSFSGSWTPSEVSTSSGKQYLYKNVPQPSTNYR